MIELNKVIEGDFESLAQVLEASVVVQRQYVEVRKGDASVYTGMLDQARVIYADAKKLFEAKGVNDPESTYYTFAADRWQAQARLEVAAGSTKGYTDAEMALFNRYVRELYDAMSAEAPFLERDQQSGKFVLGGRSAVSKWMKEYREKKEQAQRAKSAEAERLLGIKPVLAAEATPEQATTQAESGSILDLIQDADVRKAMEEYIQNIAEVCEAGHTKVAIGSLRAGIKAMSHHISNSVKRGVQDLKRAANG